MKKFFLTIFFTIFIFLISAHNVVKLSETPWKYSKIEPSAININSHLSRLNKDAFHQILFDGNNETIWDTKQKSVEISIDLGKIYSLSEQKIKFEKDIHTVSYKIEARATPEDTWVLLANYSQNPQECEYENVEEMGSVGSTVGYSQRIDYAYVRPMLNGKFRYLKYTILKVVNENKKQEDIQIKDIEVNVHDESVMNDQAQYKMLTFDDKEWETVGLPHCYNDKDSYLNSTSTFIWKGEAWYRNKFKLNKQDRNKRFYLEFKSIGIAASVYINGKFKQGNTTVPQPGNLTHVGCFIPFIVDITDEVVFDKENILAVQVSNSKNSFFTWPNFGVWEAFGMGWGGIYSDVNLHIVNDVYIPGNAFSASNEWGTYNVVESLDDSNARIAFHTNVSNKSSEKHKLTLIIQLINADNEVVKFLNSSVLLNGEEVKFVENVMNVENPILWYPNNSEYGKPYLYKVRRILSKGKRVIDSQEEYLGIRTVSWDNDYCFVNGKRHILKGFGHRNMYPALGCAIPNELQWKDISYIAKSGGNTLRIGHSPPLPGFLEACDHFGVMLIVNSGDNEWSLKNEPANTYKREYDRNVILALRNHPSVILWESNNGLAKDGDIYYPSNTLEIAKKYDPVNTRLILNRDWYPPKWDTKNPIVIGFSNWYTKIDRSPSLNTEVYGANWGGRASWNIARFDYDNEKRFTEWYVNNYLSDLDNKACGWLDWMLAETQGESYTIYLNGRHNQKSLGSCAMDANRFPKLKFRVYEKALWVPFEKKPGVTLQSSWDNHYPIQNIDVWSNCPYVEVFVNDRSYGVKENTFRTKQLTWENIVWEEGCLKAFGLNSNKEICCIDTIYSSDEPYALTLELEPLLIKPDGSYFRRTANGSNVAIITAKVVDRKGHLCSRANIPLKFEVKGEGVYCGSADFYITEGKPVYYHSPGDKELQAEGGLMRIAIKSTFNPGKVIVTVNSNELKTGKCQFSFD